MTQQLKMLSFTALFLMSATCSANSGAREQLVNQVEAFLWDEINESYPDAEQAKLKVKAPDARLDLSRCVSPELSLQGTDRIRGRVLVRATCSPSYAVHLSATIEVLQSVVVAHRALNRKHTLTNEDLDFATVNILSNQRQFLTRLEQAAGNSLTRSVRAGTALTQGMVKAPDLVTRGDSVVIVASRGDLTVRMPGIAMMTGGKDDQINVRNQSSDRVVKGWIKAPGEVHVPF